MNPKYSYGIVVVFLLAIGLSACKGDISPYLECGNNMPEDGEDCDHGTDNGTVCVPDPGSFCQYCSNDCELVTVNDGPCPEGTALSHGVCLLEVPGNTYFVSLDGSDSNTLGSYEEPWGTWQHAFDSVSPGDIVYFRGGVYMVPADNRGGYPIEVSGTETERIVFANFPGEKPILDFSEVLLGGQYNSNDFKGIKVTDTSYITLIGLTVRNLWQRDADDEVAGAIYIARSYDIIVENCVVHDIGGSGFCAGDSDEVHFINCDAYHCVDYLTTALPGNDGTGFLDFNWTTTNKRIYYKNCRAWNCGDQGFSSGSISYTEYDGCWSFDNGVLEGGGHGFKMGWISQPTPGLVNRLYKNNIAANNRRRGFDSNDQGYECGEMNTFNNFAYNNGCTTAESECQKASHGFYVFNTLDDEAQELKRVYYNNGSFDNEDGEIGVGSGAFYTHENNSWDLPITMSSIDFVNLDTAQLIQDRNPDGSLPDITFGHLAPGSDLIDAGMIIPGVHCTGAGEHAGDDCVEWYGAAPDIGPFESGGGY